MRPARWRASATRRYHGLLIAALPAPLGRTMMFNHLAEEIRLPDGRTVQLGAEETDRSKPSSMEPPRSASFRCGWVCRYGTSKSTGFSWRNGSSCRTVRTPCTFRIDSCPARDRCDCGCGRRFNSAVTTIGSAPPSNTPMGSRFSAGTMEIAADPWPRLHLQLCGDAPAALVIDRGRMPRQYYRMEAARGYDSRGELWNPGYFRVQMLAGQEAVLVASTEPWPVVERGAARSGFAIGAASGAADCWRQRTRGPLPGRRRSWCWRQISSSSAPDGRVADAARAQATGDEVRTVIAGYYWFGDWGRDTMISLEGLTLCTGRTAEAGWILRTFANYVRDGLIPNLFPEGENEGLYHTADATLWFFHALARYLATTDDRATLAAYFAQAG